MSQSRGLGIGWCQVMDWELCPGSARGCDGTVSSAGVDGVWVWHLACWEFPIRALLTPTRADWQVLFTCRVSGAQRLCVMQLPQRPQPVFI